MLVGERSRITVSELIWEKYFSAVVHNRERYKDGSSPADSQVRKADRPRLKLEIHSTANQPLKLSHLSGDYLSKRFWLRAIAFPRERGRAPLCPFLQITVGPLSVFTQPIPLPVPIGLGPSIESRCRADRGQAEKSATFR